MADSFRQGDVLIVRADKAKPGAEVKRDNGRVVLASGEKTGHHHAIADRGAKLFERMAEDRVPNDTTANEVWARAERILTVTAKAGVTLRHEEHGPITIPKGHWIVRIQREYHPEQIRTVQD